MMNHKGTDEVIDQVFNADRWTELAGLQTARPEPQELTALDEVAAVTGHAWEVRVERPTASIAHETLAGTSAILLVTSGRSLDEVSSAFSEKGITQLVRGVEYLGPVSGRANVTDEKLLLRLVKLNTIERLDRCSIQNAARASMTADEREAHKAEIRRKLAFNEGELPASIRSSLEPDPRDDPFKVAERQDQEDCDRDAQRQKERGVEPTPSHLQRKFGTDHWTPPVKSDDGAQNSHRIFDSTKGHLVDIETKVIKPNDLAGLLAATGS